MKKQNAVTLISLVVTIIVLLILAGISINVLVGDNGIINKSIVAKENTEIALEKDYLALAIDASYDEGTDTRRIDKALLQKNLDASTGEGKTTVYDYEEGIVVKFNDSGRYYELDNEKDINQIEVTNGEKEITLVCVTSNGTEIGRYSYKILKDNFSFSLTDITYNGDKYIPVENNITGTATESKEIKASYYFVIPESMMVFTGLTSAETVATDETQIVSYMLGNNGSGNGNALNSKLDNLSVFVTPETHNGKPVTVIGPCAFKSIYNIIEFTVSSNIIKMSGNSFQYCKGLQRIIYNNTTNAILTEGFQNSKWTQIEINEGNTAFKVIDNVLYSYDETKIVKVPPGITGTFIVDDKITIIGTKAFAGSDITNVIISDNVKMLETYAFYGAGITEITIGSGVIDMGQNVFQNCGALQKIIYKSTSEKITTESFWKCDSWTQIEVNEENTAFKAFDNILYSYDKSQIVKIPRGKSGVFTVREKVTGIHANAFKFSYEPTTVIIDSPTIANGLTSQTAYSNLINSATTIYVKSNIASVGSYVTENFSIDNVAEDDSTYKEGYIKYVKN